jgi:hypothetical protein
MPRSESVDAYLVAQSDIARRVLKIVRATIKKAGPKLAESVSYKIPTYTLNEKPVVFFGAWNTAVRARVREYAPRASSSLPCDRGALTTIDPSSGGFVLESEMREGDVAESDCLRDFGLLGSTTIILE